MIHGSQVGSCYHRNITPSWDVPLQAWHADTRRFSAELPCDVTAPWVTALATCPAEPVFVAACAQAHAHTGAVHQGRLGEEFLFVIFESGSSQKCRVHSIIHSITIPQYFAPPYCSTRSAFLVMLLLVQQPYALAQRMFAAYALTDRGKHVTLSALLPPKNACCMWLLRSTSCYHTCIHYLCTFTLMLCILCVF